MLIKVSELLYLEPLTDSYCSALTNPSTGEKALQLPMHKRGFSQGYTNGTLFRCFSPQIICLSSLLHNPAVAVVSKNNIPGHCITLNKKAKMRVWFSSALKSNAWTQGDDYWLERHIIRIWCGKVDLRLLFKKACGYRRSLSGAF